MKRLAVLYSILILSSFSIHAATTIGEKWIYINVGVADISVFVPIPTINFKAEQVTPSQYTLSWLNQAGATSYKIERLVIDQVNDSGDLTLPTTWEEIANTTALSLTVNHDLDSFELGGHQTYRLSSCQQSSCEPLSEVNYFILAEELDNTIPQQFTITEDTTTTTSHLDFAKTTRVKSVQQDYRRGYGYSMLTGYSDGSNIVNSLSESGNERAVQKAAKNEPLQRSATIETRRFILNWQPVDKATHYVIMRNVLKLNSPTKSFLKSTNLAHNATTTQYQFELIGGDYEFEVYACTSKSLGGKVFEYCGGAVPATVTNTLPPYEPVVERQPQNIAYSDSDAVVDYGQPFSIVWENPSDFKTAEVELEKFEVAGELAGILGTFIADPSKNQYELIRNDGTTGRPFLQAGRQYCYKITPIYRDLVTGGNAKIQGEVGFPSPVQCIRVGQEPAIATPDYLTTVRQITDPNAPRTKGLGFSWGYHGRNMPSNVVYYQLDKETVVGSSEWEPVYFGPDRHKVLFLEEISTSLSYSFRVSACDANGRCGNYRRLYFYNQGFTQSELGDEYKEPLCLFVPSEITSGESLDVEWCKPQESNVGGYTIVNADNNVLFNSKTSNYTLTDNGMMKVALNNIVNPALNQRCFTVNAQYSGDPKNYSSDEFCTDIRPNVPTNFSALTGGQHLGSVLLDWDDMPSSTLYQVYQAYCDNGCTTPSLGSWDSGTYVDATLWSQKLFEINNDGTYFYRVKACGQQLCSAFSPIVSVIAAKPNVPNQPSIGLTDGATATFTLDWADVAGATEYLIEWADCNGDCNSISESDWQIKGSSTSSELSMPRMQGGHFAFSVRACNVICSERSVPATIELIVVDTPVNPIVSIVELSTRTYQLRWNAVVDADSYKVQWALCGSDCAGVTEDDWQLAATVNNANQWQFDTQANQFYTLRVAACKNGICSDYSAMVDMPRGVRTIRFIHSDNLGSPVAETDMSGEEK